MAAARLSRPSLHSYSHKIDEYGNKRAMLFRPPASPGPSSPDSRQQINSRKRSRASSPAMGARRSPNMRSRTQVGYFDTPVTASQTSTWSSITPNAAFESPAARFATSPPPFVDTRYDLAYGVDGATDAGENAEFDGDRYVNERGRRRWSIHDSTQEQSNKRARPSDPNGLPSYSAGFTSLVFSFVTGFAGRMLQFAKQSAPFKGFHAGGGQGYTLPRNSEDYAVEDGRRSQWEDVDPSLGPASPYEVVANPMPGVYPESPPEDRAAKRKRDDGGGWVMVPTPPERDPAIAPNSSRPRLSVPVQHDGGGPPNGSQIARPVSRTGSRRSFAPTMVARKHSSTATHAGSPSHSRAASFASPRAGFQQASPVLLSNKRHSSGSRPSSSSGRPSTATGYYNDKSPAELSPDAQLYQARIKKRERQQDKSMRQMNAKLQALIREGQAALGTRVDVEMDGDQDFD